MSNFNSKRKPFYIDGDTLLVKFPRMQKFYDMSHAEWFSQDEYPWCHTIRGYYMEEENYIMLYWNDFEIPNATMTLIPYLFNYFPKIEWIGLGCNKGKEGEVWSPKYKIFRG